MNKVRLTKKPRYRSALRRSQAESTRARIQEAVAALLDERGAAEGITFKSVAARAGVTEMTVYRHFPTRRDLLQGLWEHLNRQMSPDIGMPADADALLAQHVELFTGFDRIAPQIAASISTPQGREMRAAVNDQRRQAFLAIVREVAPRISTSERVRAAAVLQLLHSAYAWASMREQWGLTGAESGKATRWAIEALLHTLRTTA